MSQTALPETLYKYVSPDRVDVLQNLRIRYTQFSALNDPFDALPEAMQQTREWYLERFNEKVELEIAHLGIQSGSKKKQHYRARKKEFEEFYRRYTDKRWLEERSNYVQHMAASVQGCLSLTANPKNILMWSHYGKDHTGFLLGFHPEHDYFGHRVQRVDYSTVRPHYNPFRQQHGPELFYTKSTDWSYEEEYRKFTSFVSPVELKDGNFFLAYKDATGVQDSTNGVRLFPLPGDCIKCVVLGWKSSAELADQIRAAVAQHNLSLKILAASPSLTNYEMEITPLS